MNRLLPTLLATCVAVVGCGKSQEPGSQVRSTPPPEQPSATTNIYEMNPYPRLSSKAQELKYPPGIDTVAYWGNGRFNVVLNNFFDEEASSRPLSKGVRIMRQEGSVVYFSGDDGFLVLDLAAGSLRRFAASEVIPAELSEPMAKLNASNDPQNIVFDSKTLMPVRKK